MPSYSDPYTGIPVAKLVRLRSISDRTTTRESLSSYADADALGPNATESTSVATANGGATYFRGSINGGGAFPGPPWDERWSYRQGLQTYDLKDIGLTFFDVISDGDWFNQASTVPTDPLDRIVGFEFIEAVTISDLKIKIIAGWGVEYQSDEDTATKAAGFDANIADTHAHIQLIDQDSPLGSTAVFDTVHFAVGGPLPEIATTAYTMPWVHPSDLPDDDDNTVIRPGIGGTYPPLTWNAFDVNETWSWDLPSSAAGTETTADTDAKTYFLFLFERSQRTLEGPHLATPGPLFVMDAANSVFTSNPTVEWTLNVPDWRFIYALRAEAPEVEFIDFDEDDRNIMITWNTPFSERLIEWYEYVVEATDDDGNTILVESFTASAVNRQVNVLIPEGYDTVTATVWAVDDLETVSLPTKGYGFEGVGIYVMPGHNMFMIRQRQIDTGVSAIRQRGIASDAIVQRQNRWH